MEKQIITFSADEQKLTKTGGIECYASNIVSYIEAHFDLGANWSGYDSVRAVWSNDNNMTVISTVLDSNGVCVVPFEVLKTKGIVKVDLVGSISVSDVLTDRLTTFPCEAVKVTAKAKIEGSETQPITPSQFEQFVAAVISEVEKVTGMTAQAETLPAGSQATARYENGILYLGIPQGIQGERGETGADGNGIASVVYNADYTLTLVFTNGERFTTPPIRGERGPAGADGRDGTDGRDGADGVTPSLSVGTVTTLPSTEDAYVTRTGTDENPVFDFGIPQGPKGDKGDTGEVSQAEFDEAVSDLKSDIVEYIQNDIQWARYGIVGNTGITDINNPDNNKYRLCTMQMTEVNDVSVSGAGVVNVFLYDASYTFLGSLGVWVSSKTKNELMTAQPTAKYMRVLFKRSDNSETALTDVSTYGISIRGTKLEQTVKEIVPYSDYWGYERGSLTVNGIITADDTRLRSLSFIPIESNKQYKLTAIPKNSSNKLNVSVSFYSAIDFTAQRISGLGWSSSNEVTFTPPSGANYIMFIFRLSANGNIYPSDIASYSIQEISDDAILGFCGSVGLTEVYFEQGSLSTSGLNADSTQRLRSVNYIPVVGDQSYIVNAFPLDQTKKLKISASFYNANDFTTARISYSDYANVPTVITVPSEATYMRLLVAFNNDATISITDVTNCIVEKVYSASDDEYVINANLQRQIVHTSYLGELTYVQAFCKYDGEYYSTDGDNIGVQSSTFVSESTTALTLGHGNSLQLGNNGIAYASGWDDNTIYCVDLDTLTIDSTITLPTTGYTTCAVDDINKIAYIFQRATYPDTVEHYNFIIYDYDNEQVISTKKLTNAFGGMQACDFYKGKIAVLYGLGTSAVPSGLCIYNTNGDILAEYYLDIFASVEPEGVCFDRDTHELIISLVNKKAYKIYSL